MKQSTLLDHGQSRALLIQGVKEGIIISKSGSEYFRRQETDYAILAKALSQLLTSDGLLVSLDLNTCEFPFDGAIIESKQIKFLPYGYEMKEGGLSKNLYPTIDVMSELATRYGAKITSIDLISLVEAANALSEEYARRFGDQSLSILKLSHLVAKQVSGIDKLTEDELEFISKYEPVINRLSHINSIIVKFSRQIEMSQQEDSHLSLDINHLSVGAKNQDDFMCLTGLSPVLGDPGEVQVVRTVCVEIGTLPYRTTLKETLKLRDSDQFKELRSFSREFLKVNGELDGSNLDKLKDEIVYAKRHLGHAQRAGSIARFFTYIGVPLALATPLVPALGALGVAATLGGAYATAHQHARERRFAWANIGIAST